MDDLDIDQDEPIEDYSTLWARTIDVVREMLEFDDHFPLVCCICEEPIKSELAAVDCGEVICEECFSSMCTETAKNAQAYAKEVCELTSIPPKYSEGEEATYGYYLACCRHRYTNYDQLIEDLDPCDFQDRIHYYEIRARVMQLLGELKYEEEEEAG